MGNKARRPRHREKGREETYEPFIMHYTDSGGIDHPKLYGCDPFLVHKEEMWDMIRAKENDFNPCYHDHYINTGKPVSSFAVEVAPAVYEFYSCSSQGGIHTEDPLGALRNMDLGIAEWFEDFSANAKEHFEATVPNKSLLLNLLLETIELLEGNLKVAKKVSDHVSKALAIFWKMFHRTGNYWLAWNFAIKPTISDIYNLLTGLQQANKRLKFLRERNRRKTKIHYREDTRTFSGTIPLEVAWFRHVPGGDPLIPLPPSISAELSYEVEIQLSAWAWTFFDLPDWLLDDYTSAIGMIFLTQQGVYNPVKVLWEAVPFSWLIEWLANRKAQLEKEKLSLTPFPRAQILEAGTTVHLKKMFGNIRILIDGPSGTNEYPVGDFFYSRFDRRPGLTDVDPALRLSVPTAWQISILAALGGQRLVRRR